MKKPGIKYWYLRVLAASIMTMVFIAIISMAFFVLQRLHKTDKVIVRNGYTQIQAESLLNAPIYLNGEWERVNSPGELIMLPIGSIMEAYQDATYSMFFSLDVMLEEDILLAIPNFDDEITITLNGVVQGNKESDEEWIHSKALDTLVVLNGIDLNKEWQEISISGKFSEQQVTLFKRPILLGTEQNITTLVMFDSANEMFILGILILVLVNGFVFMLFRPNHLLISVITIFDTIIMLRVFFSMNYAISMLKSFIPGLEISDRFCRSSEILVLMLGGLVGCVISEILFDPEKKAPRWLVAPMPVVYFIFMLIFPTNLGFFEQYGSIILIGTYIYTFIGVFYQYTICWKKGEMRGYYLFQFFKTSYIGVVIFWDILFWTQYRNFSVMTYLYAVFFIMHVIVRLYDNNQSYKGVEILNQSLEATVRERTQELYQANQILSEISIRDPLTKIFNRFYFEKVFENIIEELGEEDSLYVCMMDLDYFKRINDTYGHDVGDEVLKQVASIVGDHISKDSVFARIGGEEFILIYPRMSQEEVLKSVNNLKQLLQENVKVNPKHTTASFGIAGLSKNDTKKTLLKKADLALYEAKEKGRNCIELWKDSCAQEMS